MTTFEIARARIPTSMFEAIVGDLDIIMNQYGDPVDHDNEEARSRCLAPVSAHFIPRPIFAAHSYTSCLTGRSPFSN
jgi:hypothetical protein